jgi:hypothetical protein
MDRPYNGNSTDGNGDASCATLAMRHGLHYATPAPHPRTRMRRRGLSPMGPWGPVMNHDGDVGDAARPSLRHSGTASSDSDATARPSPMGPWGPVTMGTLAIPRLSGTCTDGDGPHPPTRVIDRRKRRRPARHCRSGTAAFTAPLRQ